MNEKSKDDIIIYQSIDNKIKLDINLKYGTIWLSLNQIAELFAKDKSTISRHIKNIYETGELDQISTVAKNATIQKEGNRSVEREIDYYNLDMIISIGYRVNSIIATHFRHWATQILKEYIIKGFAMDDDRLENNERIKKSGYFEELVERVSKIRTSEKLMYEKVKDIFSQTSIDYDVKSELAKEFYATIQNKFHYAITGQTAAEIIVNRIDSKKENAGLVTFKGVIPCTEDAKIAKNYLLEEELRLLTLISEMFLIFAELKVRTKQKLYMQDWLDKLDDMLKVNNLEVLQGKGNISRQKMEELVKVEMGKYMEQKQIV